MADQFEPRWRTIERVVALLERTLTPDACIEHDQQLRELLTGTMRQCDVVIRYGRPPRSTLTIVEVQDRAKKVDIATFEGWCQKREKLGAQHLICVSCQGFPESIVKDALGRGEAVRLMTLCPPNELPSFMQCTEIGFDLSLLRTREASVVWDVYPRELAEARIDVPVWGAGGLNEPVSLDVLATRLLDAGAAEDMEVASVGPNLRERTFRIVFQHPNPRVWLHGSQPKTFLIEAHISDTLEVVREKRKLEILAYEQKYIEGVLGWAAIAKTEINKSELFAQLAFTPNSNGTVSVRGQVSPLPGVTVERSTFRMYTKSRDESPQMLPGSH